MIPAFVRDQITGSPDNGWTMLGMIGGAAAAALIYGIVQLVKAWRHIFPDKDTGGQYRNRRSRTYRRHDRVHRLMGAAMTITADALLGQ